MRKILALGLYVLVFLSLFSGVSAQINPRTGQKPLIEPPREALQGITPKISPSDELLAPPSLDATPAESLNEFRYETQTETIEVKPTGKIRVQERLEVKEQLRTKLQGIKDTKKRAIVNKIDERLSALNKLLVEKISAQTDRLEQILNKLEEQANQLELAGKNASEIKSSIAASQARIKEFREKLISQAEKTYTPQITTETNLRLNVGESHQALQADLKELREELMSLKNEVLQIVVLIIKLTPKLTITPTP